MTDQLALFDASLFDDPSKTTPGSRVYIGVRSGFIKIGVSNDPQRRAKQLRLRLLYVRPGNVSDERALHRRFRAARIDREWFMPSDDLLAFIRANGNDAAA